MLKTPWRRHRPSRADDGGESREIIPEAYLGIYAAMELHDNAPEVRLRLYASEDVRPGDWLSPEEGEPGGAPYRVREIKYVPGSHTKTALLEKIRR